MRATKFVSNTSQILNSVVTVIGLRPQFVANAGRGEDRKMAQLTSYQ
jgi:hypothetical protein